MNRHNLDYIEAEFFIRKALEVEFEEKKINLPKPPTEADIEKRYPELFTQIKNLGAKGYSLSEILSNPRIS